MESVVYPWAAEVGIITWRTVRNKSRPPLPSEYLATFLVFGAFTLVGTKQPKIASALGWGIVVASFLNLFAVNEKLTGFTAKAPAKSTGNSATGVAITPAQSSPLTGPGYTQKVNKPS